MASLTQSFTIESTNDMRYITYPVIYLDLTANMGQIDVISTGIGVGERVARIYRADSPNWGRMILINQITLDPAPTVGNPARIYIDSMTQRMYVGQVDSAAAHALNNQPIHFFNGKSRFFYLLPHTSNTIVFDNFPAAINVGLEYRLAYV